MDLAIYIGYSDILDIVIIWRNIPCPHHYHYIHYVLTVLGKYLPNITYFFDSRYSFNYIIPGV